MKFKGSSTEIRQVRDFKLVNNLLYRKFYEKVLFVISRSMCKSVVELAYDMSGHKALDKTIAHGLKNFCFSGLKRNVRQYIKMCL